MAPFVFPKMPRVTNAAVNAFQGLSTIGGKVLSGIKYATRPENFYKVGTLEAFEGARSLAWGNIALGSGLLIGGGAAAYKASRGLWRGGSGDVGQLKTGRDSITAVRPGESWGISGLRNAALGNRER
jgi:hypothetical protein